MSSYLRALPYEPCVICLLTSFYMHFSSGTVAIAPLHAVSGYVWPFHWKCLFYGSIFQFAQHALRKKPLCGEMRMGGRRAGCLHLKQCCCARQPRVFRDGSSGSQLRLKHTCFSVASIVKNGGVVCLQPGCRRPHVVKCSSPLIHHPLEPVSISQCSTLG